MSNDGWFSDTYLVDLHFWNVKLRAVETRRDIAFNSNNGYTGLIRASGEVAMKDKSDQPFIKTVLINNHDNLTLAATYPLLFIYLCLVYILAIVATSILKKGNAKSG